MHPHVTRQNTKTKAKIFLRIYKSLIFTKTALFTVSDTQSRNITKAEAALVLGDRKNLLKLGFGGILSALFCERKGIQKPLF
jgi:hypothetical protein